MRFICSTDEVHLFIIIRFFPHELDGFVATIDDQLIGLITFHMSGEDCEIVTLNSIRSCLGIGSALIQSVKDTAERSGCKRLWVRTTNDNTDVLHFYQKQGFILVKIDRNAINRARKCKPSIPLFGIESIPIRDEIELEIMLSF